MMNIKNKKSIETDNTDLPNRQKLRPGSIFAIPLKDGWYGFGRMTSQSSSADIYQVKSKKSLVYIFCKHTLVLDISH
jgi:hypothetical protein